MILSISQADRDQLSKDLQDITTLRDSIRRIYESQIVIPEDCSLHDVFVLSARDLIDKYIKLLEDRIEEVEKGGYYNRTLFAEQTVTSDEMVKYLWNYGAVALEKMSARNCGAVDLSACTPQSIVSAFLSSEWFDRKNFRYDKNRYRFRAGGLEMRVYKADSIYGEAVEVRSMPSRFVVTSPSRLRAGVSGREYVLLFKELLDFLPEAESEYQRIIPYTQRLQLAYKKRAMLDLIERASSKEEY